MKTRRPRLTEKMRGKLFCLADYASEEANQCIQVCPSVENPLVVEGYTLPRSDEHARFYHEIIEACDWITRLAQSGRGDQ